MHCLDITDEFESLNTEPVLVLFALATVCHYNACIANCGVTAPLD